MGVVFNMRFSIEEIPRIEGHGGVEVHITDDGDVKVLFKVTEGIRLFESFIKGSDVSEIPLLTSRICGLCGVAHTIASAKALSNALEIDLPDNIIMIRRLLLELNTIDSHLIHIIFLSLPDIVGSRSFLEFPPIIKQHVLELIRIRDLVRRIIKVLIGNSVHGRNIVPWGFTWLPSRKELEHYNEQLEKSIDYMVNFAHIISEVMEENGIRSKLYIDRKANYMSLYNEKHYPLYHGLIALNNEPLFNEEDLTKGIKEISVSYSTAKKTLLFNNEPYFVGALARLNNNNEFLVKEALEVMNILNLKSPSYNPFDNILAQYIETIHFLVSTLELINEYEPRPYSVEYKIGNDVKRGVGVIEAPRGVLIHEYIIEKDRIKYANIITPTAQFISDLEESVKMYIKKIINDDLEQMKHQALHDIEIIVRSYDPCLSCSVHYIGI